jgi:hypothetical protein
MIRILVRIAPLYPAISDNIDSLGGIYLHRKEYDHLKDLVVL